LALLQATGETSQVASPSALPVQRVTVTRVVLARRFTLQRLREMLLEPGDHLRNAGPGTRR
jgi:hypothetical protein